MQIPPSRAPTLDRSAEAWTARFPGLGTVVISEEGGVSVEVDSLEAADTDAETLELRERALRYGWGEPLSYARRGYRCASGAAVAAPDTGAGCLLLTGDTHDAAIVILELASRGWSVMGDRITPTKWEGEALVAFPREAPVVVARRRLEKAGVEGTRVRLDTDAMAVELPRASEPQAVKAVVSAGARRPGEVNLEPLAGHQRFEAATALMVGGALHPDSGLTEGDSSADPPLARRGLADHLKLAALPYARLRLDTKTLSEDVDALVAWWESVRGPVASDPSGGV